VTKSIYLQGFPDGPCWDRTSDLGIKSLSLISLPLRSETKIVLRAIVVSLSQDVPIVGINSEEILTGKRLHD
jgi:hypothetical protein